MAGAGAQGSPSPTHMKKERVLMIIRVFSNASTERILLTIQPGPDLG